MRAGRHAYFAYGSNLCVTQMAQGCPDAVQPRPAVLGDHDWLINQRGVATVEPFAGTEVQGVVWQLSDHDLATLDSANWSRHLSPPTSPAPQSLSELLSDAGVIEASRLRSRFGFLAIHGGGLEEMTDEIAERAADAADASVYLVRHPDHYPHHLSSARFHPEESTRLAEFLDHVDVTVSLHGYGRIGRSTQLLAGGRNRALATHLARHIDLPGYRVVTDLGKIPVELRGLHAHNPVNRTREGGAQLELPPRVRGISPRSPLPGGVGLSPVTSALVQGLVEAARSWRLRPDRT